MPNLNVARVFSSRWFTDDKLTVLRQKKVISNGIGQPPQVFNEPFSGIVTTIDGRQLSREPEAERALGSIMVHTLYRLQAKSTGKTADIITWKCRQWTVTKIDDYSTYGTGFICAYCELIPESGGN